MYKNVHKRAKIDRVTKSPKLAAIGVAILSGLMFIRLDTRMTNIIRPARMRLANDAVEILPAMSTREFSQSNSFARAFNAKAPTEAKNPTMIA